jgi:hypothetical protein
MLAAGLPAAGIVVLSGSKVKVPDYDTEPKPAQTSDRAHYMVTDAQWLTQWQLLPVIRLRPLSPSPVGNGPSLPLPPCVSELHYLIPLTATTAAGWLL